MNGKDSASGELRASREHPQWSQGSVMLTVFVAYTALVVVSGLLLWRYATGLNVIGVWGLLISLVISMVGFALLVSLVLVISSVVVNMAVNYPMPPVVQDDDSGIANP